MKTKDKIVEKLLENKHITTEEAVILLKEEKQPSFKNLTPNNTYPSAKVPYYSTCGCDTCSCTMANVMVNIPL